ncbi:MAG: hypothetical protein A2Z45_10295 [Chloroflexi bacterium RBG_19FT_COMBO_55_16]|nr:MAG: hypothetical protein A2Z45_10295 [Chloroflexi bacterium RBG_19FT_COMBO_55_16]
MITLSRETQETLIEMRSLMLKAIEILGGGLGDVGCLSRRVARQPALGAVCIDRLVVGWGSEQRGAAAKVIQI